MEGFYQKCMPSWFARDFVCPSYQKGESSSLVHEEVEDVDEGGGGEEGEGVEDAEEGEQEEEDEGDLEDEQTSGGYVVTSVIDEGEQNPNVMRQYQRELEADERALEEDS
jgi:hypothetical protein